MGVFAKVKESVGDWLWINSRRLGLKKCGEHGWTYCIEDTESDCIRCPFCGEWKLAFQDGFDDLKKEIISWRYDTYCRPGYWTLSTEREVDAIVKRRLGKDVARNDEFEAALEENPKDTELQSAYADWLEEHGEAHHAKMLRLAASGQFR